MAVHGEDNALSTSAEVIWTATQAASIDHPNLVFVENHGIGDTIRNYR